MASIEKEQHIIEIMIRLYCRKKFRSSTLTPECETLLAYARQRLARCRFGDRKPACQRCPVHCYRKDMREQMRRVMRWCGPRMLLYHPLITLRHYIR